MGGVVLVIGIVYLLYGIGFLMGKGWSWTLGLVVTVLSILLGLLLIGVNVSASGTGVLAINLALNGPIVLISLVILYYITLPHVRASFGKAG